MLLYNESNKLMEEEEEEEGEEGEDEDERVASNHLGGKLFSIKPFFSNMSHSTSISTNHLNLRHQSNFPNTTTTSGTNSIRRQQPQQHLPPVELSAINWQTISSILIVVFLITLSSLAEAGTNDSRPLTPSNPRSNVQVNNFIFDPRVSAKCERNLMHITVQSDQSFNGIVHVRNYRRNPCQTYGNGSSIVTLTIDLLTQPNRPNYCGVQRVKGSEERSISLVVRLHRALELSDDKHFVITCGNTEFYNKNKNEKLMFKFVDAAGHKINKLYHGEQYRLRAEILSSSQDLQGASFSPNVATSSYHLYVRNCFIFNGNESDVELIDDNGCPKVGSVTSFKQIGHNIAEAEIVSMFKLPGTNQLHLQCMVELVDNCHFCEPTLCSNGTTRHGKQILMQPIDMQMLASTTAYVFEPDQLMTASYQANSNCTEWQFPWLIALCIMLAILLVIMMVVNIFLCSSISCSCFKHEDMCEQEPTIIEDYDPYKIDFFPPYDSRFSLNRNYHPNNGGGGGSFVSGNDSGEHFFGPNGSSHQHHHHQQQQHQQQRQSPSSSGARTSWPHHQSNHHHQSDLVQITNPTTVESQQHSNRPTVAAVRHTNGNVIQSRMNLTGKHVHNGGDGDSPKGRLKIPSTYHNFERQSPKSIRSQEYY